MRFATIVGLAALVGTSATARAEYHIFGGASYYTVGPTYATFQSLDEAMLSPIVNDGDVLMIQSASYLGSASITKAVTLELGSSPGIIEVAGSMLVNPGATVNFEIFGTDPSEYDQLLVAGALALYGEVKVSLGGSFVPSLGDSFKIADAYGILFTEGTIFTLPSLASGLSWQVSILPGTTWNGASGEQLYLTVVPAPGVLALLGVAGLRGRGRRR